MVSLSLVLSLVEGKGPVEGKGKQSPPPS